MSGAAAAGLLPHHDGSALHAPDGVERGGPVRLRLRIPVGWGEASRVWLRSLHDGEPRYDPCDLLGSADGWTWWEAATTATNPVLRYRFLIEAGGRNWQLNAQGLFGRDVSDYADFRLGTYPAGPDWLRTGTMYQIFPDRFARSVQADTHPAPDWAVPAEWHTTPVQGASAVTPYQFYGGDLPGITERLDHIQALGADIIYLTPFFPARSNHRYDAATFATVDPLLGGDQALVDLVEAAHARGLKVMGDLTANHSGDAHEWFRNALAGPDAPEAGYYYFSPDHSSYEAWYGVPSLPKLNWSSETLRDAFVRDEDSPLARWLRPPFNLDGWRIDVGNMTGRLGATDLNHDVARLIADRVRGINPDAALLAESTNDAAPDFSGEHWHGAMTYSNFTRPLWAWLAGEARHVNFFGTPLQGPGRIDAAEFLATHQDLAAAFSWDVRRQNMNALNSHDTARAATAMVDGGQQLGAVLMFTLPGVPVLFAGDEFGLTGDNGEFSRTPMPWDRPDRVRHDLRGLYAALSGLRRDQPALTAGGVRWLYADGDVLAFIRETAEATVLVAVTRADADAGFDRTLLTAAQWKGLAGPPALVVGELAFDDAGGLAPGGLARDAQPRLRSAGPAAAVWVLPGVAVPGA